MYQSRRWRSFFIFFGTPHLLTTIDLLGQCIKIRSNMSRKSKSMIEYEEIKVTSKKCNQYHVDKARRRGEDEDIDETKNIQNVMASSI
jgi:hypothetical protein